MNIKKRVKKYFVLPLRSLRLCGKKIREGRELTARFARVAEDAEKESLSFLNIKK